MNLDDVIRFILNADDDALNAIMNVLALVNSSFKFQVGMKVKIKNFSPAYWNGTEGIITGFSKTRTHGIITGFNKTRTHVNIKVTKSSHISHIKEGLEYKGFPIWSTTLTTSEDFPESVLTQEDGNALIEFMNGL